MEKDKNLIPSLPKGFRDRWGEELALKKKILSIVEKTFIKYGFVPLETPPMEISSNIGSFLANDKENPMSGVFSFSDEKESLTLRYDMSAPLARFVAQNYRDLVFPFKRYACGDVFRREKPDNARYRSFTQFDADIIGNVDEAQADGEICNIIADSFKNCGLKKEQFIINVSNRKIIQGLLYDIKINKEQETKVIRAIDKLDRLGLIGVNDLLQEGRQDESGAITKGANLTKIQTDAILNLIQIKDIRDLKKSVKNKLSLEGIEELEKLFNIIAKGKFIDFIRLNLNIVRGLEYYSGNCWETNLNFKAKNAKGKSIDIGSCASGGRYNSLIKRFKGVDFKGTGMSIGIDRLVFALNQIIKTDLNSNSILILVLDEKYLDEYYSIVNLLRDNNINSEIYLDANKNMKKQLAYADKKSFSLAIICGKDEIDQNKVTIKKLKSEDKNKQFTISRENLINEIKKLQ
tara:strand:- start:109 stop:1494 length:1386 start_codon:yes stop_codon:yes gene_type:complete